ncbi:hypothetical protein ACFL47_02175 [Candidatus Latescibacterota bacterium]
MVRPIEISDSLSKVQAVERMQHDAKVQPEALHQVQKALEEKQTERQVTTPNPINETDQLVLHGNERNKRQSGGGDHPEKHEHDPEDQGYDEHGTTTDQDDDKPHGHIDVQA